MGCRGEMELDHPKRLENKRRPGSESGTETPRSRRRFKEKPCELRRKRKVQGALVLRKGKPGASAGTIEPERQGWETNEDRNLR